MGLFDSYCDVCGKSYKDVTKNGGTGGPLYLKNIITGEKKIVHCCSVECGRKVLMSLGNNWVSKY